MNRQPVHPVAGWLQPARRGIRQGLERLPAMLAEFILFGLKMAWSCLFGGAMLALLLLTHWFWPTHSPLARYDFLVLAAVVVQALMLFTRLESFAELKVILLYHAIGTAMELFKTHVGSWSYPEASVLRIGAVPLFSGFMYGTVGSFMARAIKVCELKFEAYPPLWTTQVLAVLIYVNFFSHHFLPDLRLGLFALTGLLFWRTRIWFRVMNQHRPMPLLVSSVLTAFFLWFAENIGTLSHSWLYPSQLTAHGWVPVPFSKLGAWLLLLIVSFVCVTLVIRPEPPRLASSTDHPPLSDRAG